MDWLDLLAVQGTLKSLLQHHNSKASILQSSAFFTVQLSHPYVTTGETTALTRWTFDGKIMSLLFNMLSRSKEAQLVNNSSILVGHQGLMHAHTGQEGADRTGMCRQHPACVLCEGRTMPHTLKSQPRTRPTKRLWSRTNSWAWKLSVQFNMRVNIP